MTTSSSLLLLSSMNNFNKKMLIFNSSRTGNKFSLQIRKILQMWAYYTFSDIGKIYGTQLLENSFISDASLVTIFVIIGDDDDLLIISMD